ncbi:MAG: DUF1648 domain-containing protein [Microbacteriaceae bacterium]|nr:DUF1648 domain-containing protein [Microbacteriaceae bacterium]
MTGPDTPRNTPAGASTEAAPLARLTPDEIVQLERARRSARLMGLVLPLIMTLIGTGVTALWIPRMPDPMAVHWGGDFQPDGFGPIWSNAALALGTGLLITMMYFLQHLQRVQPNAAVWGPMHRFMPAIIFGTVLFLQVIAVGTAWLQLGLANARDAQGSGWVMLTGFLAWIIATVLAYAVQPKLTIAAPAATKAAPLPLSAGQRAVWFGTVRPARGFLWALIPGVLALAVGTVAVSAAGTEPAVTWIMLGTTVLVLVIVLTNTWFRVRIDQTGLEARSVLGWPTYRVPAADVKRVAAVQINPFAEYGGWGVRLSPTGFGIVLRTGEGLLIERHSRARSFAITLDNAAEAAAVLAAMAPNRERE